MGTYVQAGRQSSYGKSGVEIGEFQRLIEQIYYDRDHKRGLSGTFMWFSEEVGELAKALHRRDRSGLASEFADVFAWLSTLASLEKVNLEDAIKKYARGCPGCRATPCRCPEK